MKDLIFKHTADKNESVIASYNTLLQARKELTIKRQEFINHGFHVTKEVDRINVFSKYDERLVYRLSIYIE